LELWKVILVVRIDTYEGQVHPSPFNKRGRHAWWDGMTTAR
jgi:hypothetical protein